MRLICPTHISDKMTGSLRLITLDSFLNPPIAYTIREKDREEWFRFIAEHAVESMKAVKNNPVLYRIVTENRWLAPEDVDEVLEATDSIECRSILLEYKLKN